MKKRLLSLFGVNLYKRSYEELEIPNVEEKFLEISHPSLLYISSLDKLTFSSINFIDNPDFLKIAIESILLSFHQLFRSNKISFNELLYTDWVFNKYKVGNSSQFIIRNEGDNSNSEIDILSKAILDITHSRNGNTELSQNQIVAFTIDRLISNFIGESKYHNPAEEFILNLLEKYSERHNWISSKHEKRFLNLLKKTDFKIEENTKNSFKMMYFNINKDLANWYHKSDSYKRLTDGIRKSIESQFAIRTEDFDGGD